MADRMTITIDNSALLAAFDRVALQIEAEVKAVAKDTAERIAAEARARVARRTGETAAHIVVEESRDGKGYIVWVQPDVRLALHTSKRTGRTHTQRVTYNALAGWLEFGTDDMTARPFLFNSARLEEAGHDRRIREAIQSAIDVTGLGD